MVEVERMQISRTQMFVPESKRQLLHCRSVSIAAMKTSFIFIAILVCSVAGTLSSNRSVKTGMLVVCGALSLYGMLRFLG